MIKPACENAFIIKKRSLKNDYYSFRFAPLEHLERCRPGHFVHILLPSTDIPFRRAFSIADVSVENKEVTSKFLSCLVTSDHRIRIGEHEFWDWED